MRGTRNKLNRTIEELYRVFAAYGSRAEMGRCDHCIAEDDVRRLQSYALRETPGDIAARYAFGAMTTWGDERDFKHFLPRLLELLVVEPEFQIEPEALIGKLRYARWYGWPTAEREAVEAFLADLWEVFLAEFPSQMAFHDADSCLCAIAQAVDELEPYLNVWRRNSASAPLRHVAQFVEFNGDFVRRKGRLCNAWWQDRKPQMNEVLRWMLGPDTKTQLEHAFYDSEGEPFADELSQAVQWLDWLSPPRADQGAETIAPDSTDPH